MYYGITLEGTKVGETNFAFYINIAKLSQAKPQLQLSWLALASLNFT